MSEPGLIELGDVSRCTLGIPVDNRKESPVAPPYSGNFIPA
ncbi:MAG TPA: hypothetical protein VM915_00550 [Verrucomicrobiae bacterium]|nr:hypothetical protein [Verrucomicrobiae bacterium]